MYGPRYLLYPHAANAQASLWIYAQTRQSFRCSHTQRMDIDQGSDQHLDLSSSASYISMGIYYMHLRICDKYRNEPWHVFPNNVAFWQV